jgi:hypothetical protein
MPVCEGCGIRTDDAHVARRAARIEAAARYRPTQIKVLFLDSAPPARIEDFFYSPASNRTGRLPASKSYFDELGKTLGPTLTASTEEGILTEFRRKGYFLTYAVECPFENEGELHAALRRLAPTALKRVQYSIKPSYVVPISTPTKELIHLFGLIGWGDRLVLDGAGPFVDPYLGDSRKQAQFGTAFGDRIGKALAVLP